MIRTIAHLAPLARIVIVTALGVPLGALPGCRLVSGEVACVADIDCDPDAGLLCVDGTCVDPCRDPLADGCDADDDGTLNEVDTGREDPCIPDQNVAACSVGDEDNDGVNNTDDPFPGDPCRPSAEVLACFDGDEDGDGVKNGQDPAPQDPCAPNIDVIVCDDGDEDDDGVTNGLDADAIEPCVPNPDTAACASGDLDDDGTTNADDTDAFDPASPPCRSSPAPAATAMGTASRTVRTPSTTTPASRW